MLSAKISSQPLFSDPRNIIEHAGIQPGMIVADFGSGSGRFVLEVARALATTGKVYAIDIRPELAVRTAGIVRGEHFPNVDVIVGDITKTRGTLLVDACIDLVIMSNTLSQIGDMVDIKSVLTEAKRVLQPGGRVLVVDWQDSFGGIGPMVSHVIKKEDALLLFEKAGFSSEREIDAGSHHYGYMFKKL